MKFKVGFLFILLIVSIILFTGCGGKSGGSNNGTVQGTVLDNLDNRNYPVVGAVVTIGSRSATTNENGQYTITGVSQGTNLPIIMTAICYSTQNSTVNVTKGVTTTKDFTTQPSSPTLTQFGTTNGSGDQQVNLPHGLRRRAADNRLYIGDSGNNRIQVLNPAASSNHFQPFVITTEGVTLNGPEDLEMDGAYIYLVDHFNNAIRKFNTSGAQQLVWGKDGTSDTSLSWSPNAIAWGPNGLLYVLGANEIGVFNPNDGSLVGTVAYQAAWSCWGIAMNPATNKMYINENLVRIQVYSWNGGSGVGTWHYEGYAETMTGTGTIYFGIIRHLTVDSCGYIWATNHDSGRLVRLHPDINFTNHEVPFVTEISLTYPFGVALDENIVYVSSVNGTINRYSF